MCDDDMQPNPRYEALQELLSVVQGQRDAIAEALDDAVRVMEDGDAWTGPTTATTFLEDLGYRKGDLPDLAEQLIDDVSTVLQSTPAEIPVPAGGMDQPR